MVRDTLLNGAFHRVRALCHSPTMRTLATNGIITAIGLVTSIQLARWLGPTGRGEVAAAMLWPTLLVYLANLGLFAAVLYHSALPDASPGTVFWTATAFAAIQSAVAITIGWFAMPILLATQTEVVVRASRWFLFVIPLALVSQYGLSTLQARLRFGHFNVIRAIVPIGYVTGIVALHLAGRLDPTNVVLVQLGLNLVVFVAVFAGLAHLRLLQPVRVSSSVARRLFRYGAKVYVGNLSSTANFRADQAFLSAWFPPAQMGLYVAAVSAANLLTVLSTAVQMVLTPRIAAETSPEARAATLRSVFRRFWRVSLLCALVLAAVMPIAIPTVFGDAFRAAIVPAVILIGAMFLVGAKDILGAGAQALGDPWLASRAEVVAVFVTLGLLPILLPRFGIVGAALSSLTAYSVQLVVVTVGLSRSHAISAGSLLRKDARPLGISAAAKP